MINYDLTRRLEQWHEAHPIERIVTDPDCAYDPLPLAPPPGAGVTYPVPQPVIYVDPPDLTRIRPPRTEAVIAEEAGQSLGVYPPAGDRSA